MLGIYAQMCGLTLARAHARSGDAIAVSSYLGRGDRFDIALGKFAASYADQNERDFAALTEAIATGRIPAVSGV
jgi:predicted alpha/beta hydrolase